MKMTFYLFITQFLFFSFSSLAKPPTDTETGTSIMGPTTPMSPHPHSESGITRSRQMDMTGAGTGNSSLMGSDVNPSVPSENPPMRESLEKQSQEDKEQNSLQKGPYKNGQYDYTDEEKKNQ